MMATASKAANVNISAGSNRPGGNPATSTSSKRQLSAKHRPSLRGRTPARQLTLRPQQGRLARLHRGQHPALSPERADFAQPGHRVQRRHAQARRQRSSAGCPIPRALYEASSGRARSRNRQQQ